MVKTKQLQCGQRQAAIAGGISLILMSLAAFFAYGYVYEQLVVHGDAITTAANMASSAGLFQAGLAGWMIILICDIIVAWAFYVYLKPVDCELSRLGAWFRLIYTAILAVALSHLLLAALLNSNTSGADLPAQILLHLSAFEYIWSAGLILFGGHLLITGWIAWRATYVPKIISILLLAAAIGYILVHTSEVLFPQFKKISIILENVFMLPMIVGELGFGLWLLWRGGRRAATK